MSKKTKAQIWIDKIQVKLHEAYPDELDGKKLRQLLVWSADHNEWGETGETLMVPVDHFQATEFAEALDKAVDAEGDFYPNTFDHPDEFWGYLPENVKKASLVEPPEDEEVPVVELPKPEKRTVDTGWRYRPRVAIAVLIGMLALPLLLVGGNAGKDDSNSEAEQPFVELASLPKGEAEQPSVEPAVPPKGEDEPTDGIAELQKELEVERQRREELQAEVKKITEAQQQQRDEIQRLTEKVAADQLVISARVDDVERLKAETAEYREAINLLKAETLLRGEVNAGQDAVLKAYFELLQSLRKQGKLSEAELARFAEAAKQHTELAKKAKGEKSPEPEQAKP